MAMQELYKKQQFFITQATDVNDVILMIKQSNHQNYIQPIHPAMPPHNNQWYQTLNKPSITPPNYVFPIVWTILYLMIGLSSFFYVKQAGLSVEPASIFFCLQMVLNMAWTPLFFWMKQIGLALVDAVAMWACVGITIWLFYGKSQIAAFLLVPYFLWLCLATYINWYIFVNNGHECKQKKQRIQ